MTAHGRNLSCFPGHFTHTLHNPLCDRPERVIRHHSDRVTDLPQLFLSRSLPREESLLKSILSAYQLWITLEGPAKLELSQNANKCRPSEMEREFHANSPVEGRLQGIPGRTP